MQQVMFECRRIMPLNVPTMIDGDQDVLTGDDVGEIEGAVRVGLITANQRDAGWITEAGWHEKHHSSGRGDSIQSGYSTDRRASGGKVKKQGIIRAMDSDEASGTYGPVYGHTPQKNVLHAA